MAKPGVASTPKLKLALDILGTRLNLIVEVELVTQLSSVTGAMPSIL
jgi:hypothetical protein